MKLKKSVVMGGISVAGMMLVLGCWHPQNAGTTTIVAPDSHPPPAAFVPVPEKPVTDLSKSLAKFEARAAQLPGNGEVAYRAMLEDTFKDLIAILPVLEGADPDGSFRQQLHLLDQDRQQLIGLAWAADSGAIVAAGTRAGCAALQAVYSRNFSVASDMGKSMTDLGAMLDELDLAKGDASKAAVAQSVQKMSAIMRQMSDLLDLRAAAAKAAPAPSTNPTSAP